MGIEKEVEIWYAMRATYRREPDAMHLLKKENLGCFIPMQYKIPEFKQTMQQCRIHC